MVLKLLQRVRAAPQPLAAPRNLTSHTPLTQVAYETSLLLGRDVAGPADRVPAPSSLSSRRSTQSLIRVAPN